MNWQYSPPPTMGACMGCTMGADVDASGFDWDTGEYVTPSNGTGGDDNGLTDAGASVITGAFDAIADITGDVLGYFSRQQTPTPGTLPPGTPPPAAYVPQRAGMDPIMLAAIGIPVALVAVAMMRPKR